MSDSKDDEHELGNGMYPFKLYPYQQAIMDELAKEGKLPMITLLPTRSLSVGLQRMGRALRPVKAATYIPEEREGWWGGPDTRLRCAADHKVVFQTEHAAQRSADKATHRGTAMHAYLGKCGHWHTARTTRRNQPR